MLRARVTLRPAGGWRSPETSLVPAAQPPLSLTDPPEVDLARPSGRAATSTLVRARWTVRPQRGLPDACEWGAALAVAVVQALLAQRPIAQLNRWLADDVLGAVSLQQRRRRTKPGRAAVRSVVVRSVRVQHPCADVAAVSVHLLVGTSHTAVAPPA